MCVWGNDRAGELRADGQGRCPPSRLTSAIGLHGLPTAEGSVTQARRHILPGLALGRLHGFQLWKTRPGLR